MKKPVLKTRKNSRKISKPEMAKTARAATKRSPSRPAQVPIVATSPTAPAEEKRPTGKLGKLLDAVTAKHGASLSELVELTGWQSHTVRAALTRLRQQDFAIGLQEINGRKVYTMTGAAPR